MSNEYSKTNPQVKFMEYSKLKAKIVTKIVNVIMVDFLLNCAAYAVFLRFFEIRQ